MQTNILFRGISFFKKGSSRYGQCNLNKFNFNKFFHEYSSSNSGGNKSNRLTDVIEEREKQKKNLPITLESKYFFHQETIALERELPVFPFIKTIIDVDEMQYRILNPRLPLFLTTITKIANGNIDKSDKDLKSQYYPTGTYCFAELTDIPNKLMLQSMHRVDILNISSQRHNDGIHGEKKINIQEIDNKAETANEVYIENEAQKNPEQKNELIEGLESATPENILSDKENQYLMATIKKILNPEVKMNIEFELLLTNVISAYTHIESLKKPGYIINFNLPAGNLNYAYKIADDIGARLAKLNYFEPHVIQDVFSTIDLYSRLEKLYEMLLKYSLFAKKFSELQMKAEEGLRKREAEKYYQEIFKIAKGAVESGKGKQAYISNMNKILKNKKPTKEVMKAFEEESQKYLNMDEASHESNVVKVYLDWLVSLPYGVQSEDQFDLDRARAILDEDHFGMKEIKDRILEFIAVGKLRGSLEGKILCLAGPPGVGKTSLAPSIAKALNRKYARISMGGESDSSFLKGHRKTYIGAYPGKIIQALKECGTENCVILLDEIDKLGRSDLHGDPQGNLLEILDPSQNQNFVDNFLDFPVDLSKVLFICSANVVENISPPLLDRMDLIQLSSYTNSEKTEIFHRHLLPRAINETGILFDKFTLGPNIIERLITYYCREPGVRGLQKAIQKIIEKVAYSLVKNPEIIHVQVNESLLEKYLGHPIFPPSKLFQKTPAGVIVGLAYTEYGGSLIYIEAMPYSFKKTDGIAARSGIQMTGSLGKVMQESLQIAYSFARGFAHDVLKNNFLETNEIHIHAPEGATPKDGPSAGITITSSLLSLATNTPVNKSIAMTGELSLRGKVLKIGGVKEKVLAAARENIEELIFPQANEEEVLDLTPEIKGNIRFHFVREYSEVFALLFPSLKI